MQQFTFSSGCASRSKAPKVLVYGVEGVGKSTFASQFPDPLFIDTEGSTAYLDVRRFDPAPSSWTQLIDMVRWAQANASPGSTLVVDTLDWAERMCIDSVLAQNKWASIETPGYGKGYRSVYEQFGRLLDALGQVADRGVTVVCTAHAKVEKFELPDEESSFDKWGLKLINTRNTSISAMVKEWADAVLFCNYETIVEQVDAGMGKTKGKARGNKRVIYAEHNATWDAKNRWGLPAKVPMDFSSISAFIPTPAQPVAPAVDAAAALASAAVAQPWTAPAPAPSAAPALAVPAAPAPAPMAAPAPAPDRPWIRQIRDLLATSGTDEGAFKAAVASQGYVTLQMRLEDYPDDLGAYLVSVFDSVKAVADELSAVPFS
jgi:hypothetical protein